MDKGPEFWFQEEKEKGVLAYQKLKTRGDSICDLVAW